jgi:hypothetical protein
MKVLSSLSSLCRNFATAVWSVPRRTCSCRKATPLRGFLLNMSMPVSQTSFCCLSTSSCSGESRISLLPLEQSLECRLVVEPPCDFNEALSLPLVCSPTVDWELGLTYKSLLHSTMHFKMETRHWKPSILMARSAKKHNVQPPRTATNNISTLIGRGPQLHRVPPLRHLQQVVD